MVTTRISDAVPITMPSAVSAKRTLLAAKRLDGDTDGLPQHQLGITPAVLAVGRHAYAG